MSSPVGRNQVSLEGSSATYRVLRELAHRSQRSFVAIRDQERASAVFVMNRFVREARVEQERVSAEAMATLLRDARCLAKNWHPNIARVRHVDVVNDNLFIATDMVDGITLVDLFDLARASLKTTTKIRGGPVLPTPILARIFLDILSGLSALHGLRDETRDGTISAPLSIFHGELCPANVVVGKDGVARIVNVFRPRGQISTSSEALQYAAPESLAEDEQQDLRVDIYAVGVMLWEALMGRPLYEDTTLARIAQRQREEDVPRPPGPLGEVAMRALAFDPGLRFRSAQDAAANLRAFAQTAVAAGSVVAQTIVDLAGERIRARRAALEPLITGRSVSGQRRAVKLPASTSDPPTSSSPFPSPTSSQEPLRETTPPSSGPQRAQQPQQQQQKPRSSRPPIAPLSFPTAAAVPAAKQQEVDEEPNGDTVYGRRPSLSGPVPAPVARPLPPQRRQEGPTASEADVEDDDDDDDDLPGPRQSTPDVAYLDELGAFGSSSLPPPSSSLKAPTPPEPPSVDEIDPDDILEEGDTRALLTAREVVVSTKSGTPKPPPPPPALKRPTPPAPVRPASFPVFDRLTAALGTPPVGTPPAGGTPPSAFPSFPKSTPVFNTSAPPATTAPTPLPIANTWQAPPPPPSSRMPSTRTPFVVDVLPIVPGTMSSIAGGPGLFAARRTDDERRRRFIAIIAAIAVAAVFVLLIGAAIIARRQNAEGASPPTAAAPQQHHDPGPSTVIIAPAPPPAVDSLPQPAQSAPLDPKRR